jgi:ferrous iron transport protein B
MVTLALAGNPNCGKTTIFNAQTGSHHHVGNWPGVTVERRSGFFEQGEGTVEVVDLPGTYSLSAQSEDERIAARFVADPAVDLIVNVLDASNLERNLYLSTQLLELRRPMIFVLNMMDDAEGNGLKINLANLEKLLGAPVIPTVGNREEGVEALKDAITRVTREAVQARAATVNYGPDLEAELLKIQGEVHRDEELAQAIPPRWLALQLLERNADALALVEKSHARKAISTQVKASLAFLEPHLGADGPTLVAERRYGFAHGLVQEVLKRTDRR